MAALLARPLYAQGRHDDAERYVRISEELGGRDDVATAMLRRGTEAKILARRGQVETAESVAREAVSLAQRTDFINDHADVLMDLAEVLKIVGRGTHAVPIAQRALSLYQQKGNVVSGGAARRMLEVLRSVGS
jgi:Flp pilus assembly protein TadD